MSVLHRPWRLQWLVVEVESGSATSCGWCVGGGSLLNVINKWCNVTEVLYSRI